MGLISIVKRWITSLFKTQAEKDFGMDTIRSPEMDAVLERCANIYRGVPSWVSQDDGIRTVNFAKSICSEVARLTTLAIGITIDGSARAQWLQEQINKAYFQIRGWTEYGTAYGTIILKPNGEGFDVFTPFDFILTESDGQSINGIVFKDSYAEGEKYYTRLEYHRFLDAQENGARPYCISNKAYVSSSSDSIGEGIALSKTRWSDLLEETPPILKANGEQLDGPMFGVLRMPGTNSIDIGSPLRLPVYADAVEELRDLDVAYSRNAGEIFDSEKIILLDSDRLVPGGTKISKTSSTFETKRKQMKLPHYVRNVYGDGAETFYQEINPQLNTDQRLTGLNALLSQIGYKCGFSNGYFVFNQHTGMVTATQVESDDRRTIQLIKDVRDQLESCLDGAIYAMNIYADLYSLAPVGTYKTVYDFGDITYSYEEDKQTWWKYVIQGKVPFWYYLSKFEGFSEEEAKQLEEAAVPDDPEGSRLFGSE